jgi:hypothetical protein
MAQTQARSGSLAARLRLALNSLSSIVTGMTHFSQHDRVTSALSISAPSQQCAIKVIVRDKVERTLVIQKKVDETIKSWITSASLLIIPLGGFGMWLLASYRIVD